MILYITIHLQSSHIIMPVCVKPLNGDNIKGDDASQE
jgi:hypothetical protein